ncbi:unnamed protein product [marine sediment metagenome]|uniref:Uncharacterized protein n=1 Tax=marine sediment metagenome TaxID=412755 RepID=X1QTV0_9ZZZZ
MAVAIETEKARGLGEPRTDAERVMAHHNVSREEAERWLSVYSVEKLLPKRGTGTAQGTAAGAMDKGLETKVERLRTELDTLRDEVYGRLRGVRLSDWVLPEPGALIVNPERAKATPCKCFTYKGRDYCWSPGAIGMLKQEEEAIYCPTKEYEARPGITQRFEEFSEAAEEAHKEIESIPKGERLEPWLEAMGKALSKRGIEV